MSSSRKSTKAEGLACLGLLFLWIVSILLGGLLWDYSVNNWLLWAGKPQAFEYWHGCLLSILPPLSGLSLPCAAVTFILSFFM